MTPDELRALPDWQPGIIASIDHVLQFHTVVDVFHHPQGVATWAGQKIRFRVNDLAHAQIAAEAYRVTGCRAERHLEIHPDDAARLWPDLYPEYSVALCEHWVLTD